MRVAIVVEQARDRVGGDRHRELGVAQRLEPPRADDAVLAAGAPDLELVDVVEQGGGLDQRAVDRDLRLGHQAGGGNGDAGHALGMDDDPVGQIGVVEQAPGGGSVGDGHGPMLPAGPAPCTGRGGGPAGIGPHAEGAAVGDDLDVAVEIGAEDGELGTRRERGQRLRCRMAVLVALARGDDRDAGLDGGEQRRRGRRASSRGGRP